MFFFASVAICFCIALLNPVHSALELIPLELNGKTYRLEIASTDKQRQRGLMHRTNLAAQAGMLFIYPKPALHRIWMKNTLIPLTVIWLDEFKSVIHIKQLIPCSTDPCPSFGSRQPAKYIIELNANNSDIRLGDSLSQLPLK